MHTPLSMLTFRRRESQVGGNGIRSGWVGLGRVVKRTGNHAEAHYTQNGIATANVYFRGGH